MCDANEHAAEYVLLIENYATTNDKSHKAYAPVVFGFGRFIAGQMLLAMHAKELFGKSFAFDDFRQVSWGVKKPSIVMTFKRALPRFLQAK